MRQSSAVRQGLTSAAGASDEAKACDGTNLHRTQQIGAHVHSQHGAKRPHIGGQLPGVPAEHLWRQPPAGSGPGNGCGAGISTANIQAAGGPHGAG